MSSFEECRHAVPRDFVVISLILASWFRPSSRYEILNINAFFDKLESSAILYSVRVVLCHSVVRDTMD